MIRSCSRSFRGESFRFYSRLYSWLFGQLGFQKFTLFWGMVFGPGVVGVLRYIRRYVCVGLWSFAISYIT